MKKKGFTLIELLVVIAIISLLSSVVLASLKSARLKAGDARIKSQLNGFRTAAEIYYSNQNGYSDGGAAANAFNSGGMIVPSLAGDVFSNTSANTAYIHITTGVSGNLPSGVLVFYTRDTGGIGFKATKYAVAVTLVSDPLKAWCVDSYGNAKEETEGPDLGSVWASADLFSNNLCL